MSDAMEWVKLSTDMFENRKLRYIQKQEHGNELCLLWVRLLCLAGQSGTSGELWLSDAIPYDVDMLAIDLGIEQDIVEKGIALFNKLDMVTDSDGVMLITGWQEHQAVDNLERTRELTKERVRRYRERKQDETETETAGTGTCNADVTHGNVTCNADVTLHSVTVTQQSKSKSKSKRECVSKVDSLVTSACASACQGDTHTDSNVENFDLPSEQEVKSYFRAAKLKGDWEQFYLQYAPSGWLDAHGNAIHDWRLMARKWSKNEKKLAGSTGSTSIEDMTRSELMDEIAKVDGQIAGLGEVQELDNSTTVTPKQAKFHQLTLRREYLQERLKRAG